MHPDTNLNKFGSATDRDRKTLQQYFFGFFIKNQSWQENVRFRNSMTINVVSRKCY